MGLTKAARPRAPKVVKKQVKKAEITEAYVKELRNRGATLTADRLERDYLKKPADVSHVCTGAEVVASR